MPENSTAPLVGVIMGSKSDWETMRVAAEMLDQFGVAHQCQIVSAHRTPQWMAEYAESAQKRGLQVVIAGAGGAAHLPGMVASMTTLPVLGVPVESRALKGIDSLLSIVQMPGGVPVGTLAIGTAGQKMPPCWRFVSWRSVGLRCRRNCTLFINNRLTKFATTRCHPMPNPSETMLPGPILPGAALGILGSGQLGRMFAQAAARLGYRVHVYSPDADSPAGQVADRQTVAQYDDVTALTEFAQSVEVVTLEFENITTTAAETVARYAPVRPSGHVLHIAQNRLREKRFLESAGIPCAPFAAVTTAAELTAAIKQIGLPAVLKTADSGYDGKGQALIHSAPDADIQALTAWDRSGREPAVLEGFVDYQRELSVLVARSPTGELAVQGPIANDHVNHILDVSTFPLPELESVCRCGAGDRSQDRHGTRPGRLRLRRVFSHQGGSTAGQRNRPPPAQLWSPDNRCLDHLAVRTAGPRRSADCRWDRPSRSRPRPWSICSAIFGKLASPTGNRC